MKRFFSFLVVLTLLLSAVPTALAAGYAGWNGPEVVRAGDTITLSFYAGGGIYGGSGTLSYDSNVLTLQSCRQSIGGDWVLEWGGSNFLFYDNSMKSPITGSSVIFQATFLVNANAAPGSQIAVSATGVTLSDGDQDSGIGTVTYSTTVAEPLSDNCNLSALTVTGASISPAFSPDITHYTASVPFSTASIGVSATAEHPKATVEVHNPTLTPGGTTQVEVTVTAENGAKKTYVIAVTREQDPNYIPSSNANLQSLSVANWPLSPAFQPEVTQYYVWLPYEVDSVKLSAAAADPKASVTADDSSQLPTGRTDLAITVTAEDQSQKVYIVTVVRAPSHDQVEDYLNGHLAPVIPAPTVPEETQPAETQPEEIQPTEEPTVPAATEPQPQAEPEAPGMVSYILPCAVSFLVGVCLVVLVFTLRRRSYSNRRRSYSNRRRASR